jgi:hypothetical protein
MIQKNIVNPSGPNEFYFYIKNVGNMQISYPSQHIMIKVYLGSKWYRTYYPEYGVLGAFDNYRIEDTWNEFSPGRHEITVEVLSLDFEESDETNNRKTVYLEFE